MDQEFQEIRQLFMLGLLERQERIEAALKQFAAATEPGEQKLAALRDLHREVHNLAAAAGGYQFVQLSRKSQGLENLIVQLQRQAEALDSAQHQQLSQETNQLLAQIQQESTGIQT